MGKPFVLQLENRPGELAHITRALAIRGVNIEHISGTGAGDKMCALLTTDRDDVTREVLRSIGVSFVEGDTLHVEIADEPGALASLTERLARAGVNVTGIVMVGCRGHMREVAFSVDDEAKAREVLGLPPVYHLAGV